MSQISKNILANALGRGWSMLSVFIFIPIYISILGVKMYGVISFYAILQGMLIFIDAGLTATLRRELAKGKDSLANREHKYKILRSIELIYLVIVIALISGVFLSSDYIVGTWLNIEDLDLQSTSRSVRIMGLALGLNFFSTLFYGGLLGLEKQVTSNILQFSWSLVKNVGVILVLLLVQKSLDVFFWWQALSNLIYVLGLRYFLIKYLKNNDKMGMQSFKDFRVLGGVWKFATGMLVISFISAVNNQFDKLFISNSFSISKLAIYTVAYSLAMIPIVISTPIATAVFPRLVKYKSNNERDKLISLFNNSFVLTLLFTASAGVSIAFNSKTFLLLWTQNEDISKAAAMPAALLLLGQMLLSFQVIPFNLSLAKGDTKTIIRVGVFGVALFIPLVVVLAKYYGIIGAALSWLLNSIVITPILILLIVRKVGDISVKNWLFPFFLKPLLLIIFGNLLFYLIKPESLLSPIADFAYVFCSSLLVFMLSFRLVFEIKLAETFKFIKNELFA